jgi:hypothetical protein
MVVEALAAQQRATWKCQLLGIEEGVQVLG